MTTDSDDPGSRWGDLAGPDVFSLAEAGSATTERALRARHRVHHEAGHVWGALSETPPRGAAHGSTSSVMSPWIAAAGVLTQAVMIELDWRRWATGREWALEPADHFAYEVWARAVGILAEASGAPSWCPRGGDSAGAALICDEAWVVGQVPRVLEAWGTISNLAARASGVAGR